MTSITTSDGVQIFYKDWGPKSAQPIVFHHGWPLSSDDWDNQMLFFLGRGFRVIAHDRRGHGRSSQASEGHDMDHYVSDVAALIDHLDLRNAIHVGHSTGGGEAARYVARFGKNRVAKLVMIAAVPPLMLKTAANPAVFRSKYSTDYAASWPPIVRSSIGIFRVVHSTATTARVPNLRKRSSQIGGVRA